MEEAGPGRCKGLGSDSERTVLALLWVSEAHLFMGVGLSAVPLSASSPCVAKTCFLVKLLLLAIHAGSYEHTNILAYRQITVPPFPQAA